MKRILTPYCSGPSGDPCKHKICPWMSVTQLNKMIKRDVVVAQWHDKAREDQKQCTRPSTGLTTQNDFRAPDAN